MTVEKDSSHSDYDYDDDVPLSMVKQTSNWGTCSSKRPLDDIDSLHISVKKSKMSPDEDDDEDYNPIFWRYMSSIKLADKSFSVIKEFIERELALVEKLIERYQTKRRVEEQRLQSLERDFEECMMEDKKKQASCFRRIIQVYKKMRIEIEKGVKELVAKEAEVCLMEDMIRKRKKELKTNETELRHVMDDIDHEDGEREEEELKRISEEFAECTKELKNKEEDLDAMETLIAEQAIKLESERNELLYLMSIRRSDQCAQMKDFESMKKQFEGQVNELESKEKHFEGRMKELESNEKYFEARVKELESKEKQFECQVRGFELNVEEFESQMKEFKSKKKRFKSQRKELKSELEGWVKQFESKEEEIEGQVKDLESKKKHFESQVKEIKSKEKQFGGRMKELESREKQLEGRVKEFESKEVEFEGQVKEFCTKQKHFESRVKELGSKEKQFEGRVKEFGSKEKQFEGRVKEFRLKEEEFKVRVKELESREEELDCRVKDFESVEKQFEGRRKELQTKENKFQVQVRELEFEVKQFEVQLTELKIKENQFDGQVRDLESELNKFDGQMKELELREKQCDVLMKSFEKEIESANQLTPTIDGRSYIASERRDELESLGNDILVNLLPSSDPSKLVLDIIQNPIILECKKGDNAVAIDGSHIILLEHLMRISPAIKPHVREEAMKLALDLKAFISVNSVVVLLLLSIYGLVHSFDEDEVFKLFGFAAQHKIAVELFGTFGFAHKISDFVQNLIRKQQYIEAVRFICAYNLADKYQPVDLLREHVQNAKLISESSCKKTNSIEIKDKARYQEIASIRTVLMCISDNNIESEDLRSEIQDRILELNRQKGK